jgi:hypothetical protein
MAGISLRVSATCRPVGLVRALECRETAGEKNRRRRACTTAMCDGVPRAGQVRELTARR